MLTLHLPTIIILAAACGDSTMAPEPAVDGVAEAETQGSDSSATGNGPGVVPVSRPVEGNGILGNGLPGNWRPFQDSSPWNWQIPAGAPDYPGSDTIITFMAGEKDNLRFARTYTIPVWVVDSAAIAGEYVKSDVIFDTWDTDRDGWSDVKVPLLPQMWAEPTSDGHICIVDPRTGTSWEMSRFARLPDGTATCTTFNIWDLDGRGYGHPSEGNRWGARGGRGSGFPIIAGLLRPEEIEDGEIRHALVFTFSRNRVADNGDAIFINPPACRSDGDYTGAQHPIEGMLFQLDPSLDDSDFDSWGLTAEAKVVARALQRYGMYLGDNGGAMAIQAQLLGPSTQEHLDAWDSRFPGLFRSVENIPTDRLRVVHTADPMTWD